MTTSEDVRKARELLEDAEENESYGRQAFDAERWASAVAFATESTEYSLKAALLSVGVVPSDEHFAVPDQLRRQRSRFPRTERESVDVWVVAGQDAARHRNKAKYGDIASGRTRRDLFKDPRLPKELLEEASRVHNQVKDWVLSLQRRIPSTR